MNIFELNSLILKMFVFVAYWRLSCAFWLEECSTEGNFLSFVLLNEFLAFEHG